MWARHLGQRTPDGGPDGADGVHRGPHGAAARMTWGRLKRVEEGGINTMELITPLVVVVGYLFGIIKTMRWPPVQGENLKRC